MTPLIHPSRRPGAFALGLLALIAGVLPAAPSAEETSFFESKIRPVLAQECYECHSVAGKKKGGLLLDSRGGWQAGGETGPAIVPGDPGKSLFMQAVRHEHEDLKMPKAGAKLTDAVLADFEKWIRMGAPDPRDKPPTKEELAQVTDWKVVLARRKAEGWAFQPVTNPMPPQLKGSPAIDHPVDRFVRRRIEEAGLRAAGRADATALIRRLSFIITGLPPMPEEVAAFSDAYAKNPGHAVNELTDRLLASPSFGEKWARHWMDWVRYAETYGSEGDPAIPHAWRYRDYLIRAFNQDVPYPQLVREAIAGDLLPQPRVNRELGINESALGIGQLRMVLHGFSPVDSLDEMVTFTDNQIDVVSKAFLGLTVSCARCHNHKFDPISQTDFYAWFGIFSSTRPAAIDVNLPDLGQADRAELVQLKSRIRKVMGRTWLEAAAKLPKIVPKPDPRSVEVLQRWDLAKEKWFADGAGVRQGPSRAGEFSVALEGDKLIGRIHPAGVFTDLVSTKDRGVLMSPRFRNEGGTLWMRSAGARGSRVRYIVDNYPRTGTIHKAKDFKDGGDEVLGWRKLDLEYWKGDDIFIQATTAADMPAEFKTDERSWFGLTEVVITRHDETPPETTPSGDPMAAVRAWVSGSPTSQEAELLDALLREGRLPNDGKQLPEAAGLVARYREIEARLPVPTRAPGVLEADGHDAPLFTRGDHKQPAALVPRRFLEGIDPSPYFGDGKERAKGAAAQGSGRLSLAESLVSRTNPLTARVIVNRIWHHVFGRGIVASTDNFGRLGEEPTHPELLDYLAARFTAEGGSIKALIKLLVTSATFQSDSRATPGSLEKDPENKLLAHFPVRRLEAESIRDSMLAVSGSLEPRMFGESVAGGDPRRSVYVRVIRNNLDPLLTVFDAPVPSGTRGRRDATNVPAQSLTLLNDPNVARWSQSFARRVLEETSLKDDASRVKRMFALALGREPRPGELEGSLAFLNSAQRDGEVMQEQLATAENKVRELQGQVDAILGPARRRLEANLKSRPENPGQAASAPEPFAEWDFKKGVEDQRGSLKLSLEGKARVEDGALVLDGAGSYAKSARLPKTMRAKTMEAWVMLDNLEQRGGGVMTLQDDRGDVFDSIVFAEKEAGCWVPGSNFFRRSKNLDAPRDTEASQRVVHVAISYAEDGTVAAYRDGRSLGKPYASEGPAEFAAGKSEVLLGLRHGTTAGGNRLLHGRIFRARLYDRALSADEIAAGSRLGITAGSRLGITAISTADVIASLPVADQSKLGELRGRLETAQKALAEVRDSERTAGPESAWKSFAQSVFNLKEFIYLR